MIREPAVAGSFYPAGAAALGAGVDQFLGHVGPAAPAIGVVVPHAGYVYSGSVAGATYAVVTVPARVVVMGPNHTGLGFSRVALSPAQAWRTPLGRVARDEELCDALAGIPGVGPDAAAHAQEHSLEVQLPFLQRRRPDDLALTPLCLSHLSWAECQRLAAALAATAGKAGALLVASSDMSHYLPAAEARRVDARALEPLLALDAEELYRRVHEEEITMCGVIPAVVMLLAARALGARTATLVRYAHSGEVNGDDDRVVGYAGVVVR